MHLPAIFTTISRDASGWSAASFDIADSRASADLPRCGSISSTSPMLSVKPKRSAPTFEGGRRWVIQLLHHDYQPFQGRPQSVFYFLGERLELLAGIGETI